MRLCLEKAERFIPLTACLHDGRDLSKTAEDGDGNVGKTIN